MKRKPDTLLLIRLDAIGDYILFRNFLKILREREKYNNYKITLCGNIAWKELAETLDKNEVDEFIWIDRKLFLTSFNYKYKILKQIHAKGFEIVVDTIHSRELLFGDALVKASNAIEKIGSQGSTEPGALNKRNFFSRNVYTSYILASKENLFEFYRNKEFFEKLLETKLEIQKPTIDVSKLSLPIDLQKEYAVIFPGASEPEKTWSVTNFIKVAEYLKSHYALRIVVAGSIKEKTLGNKIINSLGEENIDLTGKTSLSELAKVISSAKILISNDTSAVHFAAAVNTPFICVSNGNRFGRFHPYPSQVFDKAQYIYPPEIMSHFDDEEKLTHKYRFNSDLNINSITPEKVIESLKKVLKNK